MKPLSPRCRSHRRCRLRSRACPCRRHARSGGYRDRLAAGVHQVLRVGQQLLRLWPRVRTQQDRRRAFGGSDLAGGTARAGVPIAEHWDGTAWRGSALPMGVTDRIKAVSADSARARQSVNIMVMASGRKPSVAKFESLLKQSGFALRRRIERGEGTCSVLEVGLA
jgi:hypothetical protein